MNAEARIREGLTGLQRTVEAAASEAPKTCLFCRVAKSRSDRRDLVLARRPHAMLMLNRYPYASAHLMVAVNRHAARFLDLERD